MDEALIEISGRVIDRPAAVAGMVVEALTVAGQQ